MAIVALAKVHGCMGFDIYYAFQRPPYATRVVKFCSATKGVRRRHGGLRSISWWCKSMQGLIIPSRHHNILLHNITRFFCGSPSQTPSSLPSVVLLVASLIIHDTTTRHNTTQHNTTQHNTTQHNTTQHNTTQHNSGGRVNMAPTRTFKNTPTSACCVVLTQPQHRGEK